MDYRAAILADSPAGYYRMDEASGATFADSSGGSNTLTFAAPYNISYSYAGLLLGDSNNAIRVPNDTSGSLTTSGTVASPPTTLTAGMTAECWINYTALPLTGGTGGPSIIKVTLTSGRTWEVYLYSSSAGANVVIRYTINSQSAVSSSSIPINQPCHIVALYDTSYFDIYLNNSRIVHAARTTDYSAAISDFNLVGKSSIKGPLILDEIAYYTRALTPTEIATHYGFGIGALIDPRGNSRPVLRPRFNPTAQSIFTRGL